jgi:HAE1 family hydrophobic/amphiphilic exporter-1
MVLLSVLILGGIAFYKTPLEFIMRIDVPFLWCYIPYPGATPQQVEQEVAVLAEGEFKTLRGLERVTTQSHNGGCNIALRFGWDADMGLATAELRDRIERLKLDLPQEIDRIFIRRFSTNQEPVLRFALFRDRDQDDLARSARTYLKSRLLRVDGVADVEVSGRELQEVYVDFNQQALGSLNLGLYDVVGALQTASFDMGLGSLEEGNTKFLIRMSGEYETPAELEDLLVAPQGIRLKDVATVRVAEPDGASSFSVDGKQGVFITIQKESEANAVETCDRVHAELAQIHDDPRFADAEVFVFHDQSEIIRFALTNLMKAGVSGSFLAFLVLYVFLRRIRPTLVVSMAIPASLVFAFVYVYLTGRSLNVITIASMIVSAGMLVDNAIVVIENIHRHRLLGVPHLEAALRGTNEVAMAITASTLTTIVVFIPTIYLEAGELSMFMKEFAGPVTAALLASLLLAMTLLPLAESRFRPPVEREHPRFPWLTRLGEPVTRLFVGVRTAYGSFLTFTLQRRPHILALLALVCLATYWMPFRQVGMQQLPSMDQREIRVTFRADPNYGNEGVRKTVEQLQATIMAQKESLGLRHIYIDQWSTGANLRLFLLKADELAPGAAYPYTTEEVRDIVSSLLPTDMPGAKVDCGIPSATPNDTSTVSVRILGNDTSLVNAYADDFVRLMALQPALSKVKADREDAQEEIQVRVDGPKASAVGATPTSIARTVGFALSGTDLPFMKQDGREIRVRAQLQESDRETVEDLENVSVQSSVAGLVPLNTLVHLEKSDVTPGIFRENGKSVATVLGTTSTNDLTIVQSQLRILTSNISLPRGYSFSMGDEFRGMDQNLANFRSALIMSCILIYIVMAALFESPLLPLSILSTVALAFLGVYWSLFLTGTPMDTVALVGSILMCGVIVNNGIVIVDHINQLRLSGMARHAAIVEAGRNRFQPVMMTSLTTILGMLPIAIGSSEGGVLNSLGRALVGGLTVGTLLTLVVVPIVYTLIDDLQSWMRSYVGQLMAMRRVRS